MRKIKIFYAILLVTLIVISSYRIPNYRIPNTANAWDYTDGTAPDTKYEEFGPRADKLLIKLYASDTAEFDALSKGEIDITDWPLTKPYYDTFTTPPENESIDVKSYGAEFGLFLLDINWNNNTYLGNPPNSEYPNPVYPNPCASLAFRQALWYLHDKPTWLPEIIGEGFYYDLYTVVPPSMEAYYKPITNPYPYNPTQAAALLEANGFPWHDDNGNGVMDPGERYWDRNGNGIHDAGEDLLIHFFIRTDHPHRHDMGDHLSDEMNKIGIAVDRIYGPLLEAIVHWFYNKEVHLYTGYLELPVDPHYLIWWNSSFHWHPGKCPNTGFVNDPILDETSWAVYMANSEDDALTNCWAFQDRFAEVAAAVPWWSYSGNKGAYRTYTGGTAGAAVTPDDGENKYRGNYWDGMVNVAGYGIDSFFSMLNMHPRGFEFGDGNMAIRWGMKTTEIESFNPVYAYTRYSWKILDLMYEPLFRRNPYNLAEIRPWLAENYTVDVYNHPVYGPCTKIRCTMRSDAFWTDGTPITTADVYFTLVELDDILISRGFPPPVWYDLTKPILQFSILDPYNFEVLCEWKSIFAPGWLTDIPILPLHIWKPIAETGEDPQAPAPDPNSISSGPWRLAEYVPYSHVLLLANTPGSTVQINTPYHAGSQPITSEGYFRCYPFSSEMFVIDPVKFAFMHKLPYESGMNSSWDYSNLFVNRSMDITIEVSNITVDGSPAPDFEPYAENFTLPPADAPLPVSIVPSFSVVSLGLAKHTNITRVTDWIVFICKYRIDFELSLEVTAGATVSLNLALFGVPLLTIWSHTFGPGCTLKVLKTSASVKVALPLKFGEIDKPYKIDPWFMWFTIREDIVGSTFYDDIGWSDYPHKEYLPSPDFKVNIRDVAVAASAFGSYPGHERWQTVADITGDYTVNIRDIAAIAAKFGWVG